MHRIRRLVRKFMQNRLNLSANILMATGVRRVDHRNADVIHFSSPLSISVPLSIGAVHCVFVEDYFSILCTPQARRVDRGGGGVRVALGVRQASARSRRRPKPVPAL
jgi:hypothetical protein